MRLCSFLCFFLLLCAVFPILSYADQLEDAKAAIQNEDFEKAFELLGPLAEENNAEAQFLLGSLYINGDGVEKDDTKGLSWIMKSARQGYDQARTRAVSICLDLVNQGNANAMYKCGYMCLNGWGGEHDANDCLGWLENAGKIGHEKSSKMLANIYTEGLYGITPDEEKATYWSNLSASFAAGIDGEWGWESPGKGGPPIKLTFTFETDGNNLTGTILGFGGQKYQLRDGKIDGNDFSFRVKSSFGVMSTTTKYTGTFLGDSLKLTYTTKMNTPRRRVASLATIGGGGESPPVTFIAKRVE